MYSFNDQQPVIVQRDPKLHKILCGLCNKWFLNDCILTHLRTHKRLKNKALPVTQVEINQLKCPICQVGFLDKSSLDHHKQTHIIQHSPALASPKVEISDQQPSCESETEHSKGFQTVFVNSEESQDPNAVGRFDNDIFDTLLRLQDPLSGQQNESSYYEDPTTLDIKDEVVEYITEEAVKIPTEPNTPIRVVKVDKLLEHHASSSGQFNTPTQAFINNSTSSLKVQRTQEHSSFNEQSNAPMQACSTNPAPILRVQQTEKHLGVLNRQISVPAQACINSQSVITLLPVVQTEPIGLPVPVQYSTQNLPILTRIQSIPTEVDLGTNITSSGNAQRMISTVGNQSDVIVLNEKEAEKLRLFLSQKQNDMSHRNRECSLRVKVNGVEIGNSSSDPASLSYINTVQKQSQYKRFCDQKRDYSRKKSQKAQRLVEQQNGPKQLATIPSQPSILQKPLILDSSKCGPNITPSTDAFDSTSVPNINLNTPEQKVDTRSSESRIRASTSVQNIDLCPSESDIDSNMSEPNVGVDIEMQKVGASDSESNINISVNIQSIDSIISGSSTDSYTDLQVVSPSSNESNIVTSTCKRNIDSSVSGPNTGSNIDRGRLSPSNSKPIIKGNTNEQNIKLSNDKVACNDQECQAEISCGFSVLSNTFVCNMYIHSDRLCDAGIQTEIMELESNRSIVSNDQAFFGLSKGLLDSSSTDLNEKLFEISGVNTNFFESLLTAMPEQNELKISKKKGLLIFLMIMKCGFSFLAASAIFSVHHTIIEKLFFSTLDNFVKVAPNLLCIPKDSAVDSPLASCFRARYRRTRVILKSILCKINISSDTSTLQCHHSGMPDDYFGKAFVAIDRSGLICCQSRVVEMKELDSVVIRESGLLDSITNGDAVLTDKKILGLDTEIARTNKNVQVLDVIPQKINVYIEKVMRHLRAYNILNNITDGLIASKDRIFHACCILTNSNFIQDEY